MNPLGVSLVWVTVKDLDKALEFYTKILGFAVNEVSKEYGWAEVKSSEGALIGIAQHNDVDKFPPGSNAVITVSVADINAAISHLKKNSVMLIGDILEIPGMLKMQMYADQDGNRMQLVQSL